MWLRVIDDFIGEGRDGMEANKSSVFLRSVLMGIGMTIVYLVIGLVLDYGVTQLLSQFIIPDCSENCYFTYFNIFFGIVIVLSILGGARYGQRLYKRSLKNM